MARARVAEAGPLGGSLPILQWVESPQTGREGGPARDAAQRQPSRQRGERGDN